MISLINGTILSCYCIILTVDIFAVIDFIFQNYKWYYCDFLISWWLNWADIKWFCLLFHTLTTHQCSFSFLLAEMSSTEIELQNSDTNIPIHLSPLNLLKKTSRWYKSSFTLSSGQRVAHSGELGQSAPTPRLVCRHLNESSVLLVAFLSGRRSLKCLCQSCSVWVC